MLLDFSFSLIDVCILSSCNLGKWVVFFWYPLDFTFVCPTEIIAFGDRSEEFEAINTQVIAASCDSKFTHLAWVNTPRADGGLGDMKIPIVADFDKSVATAYGCLIPSGGDSGVPLRALYIIDPVGNLRQMTINDLPVGRNVDEILRLVKAFQFNAKYGDVCPANWQPGDLTMKADSVESKTYFSAVNTSAPVASSGASSVSSIASVDEFAAAKAVPGLVVVDFWAPWCKNCKKLAPHIESFASKFPSAKFYKVNTVDVEEISGEANVDVLPTVQFFKGGVLVGEYKGSDVAALEAAIKSHH